MTLIAGLADIRTKRSKSAHKLAACVVQDPEAIVSMSTATLALRGGVSEPTVNRFCTGLGYKGFPDFKLALAGELARKHPGIAQNIEQNDSAGVVAAKVFESTHATLTSTREQMDLGALHQAIDLLAGARSLTLCGLGASASVALDAQHKLLRFPIPVMAHSDVINQRMLVTGLGPQDCLVCISYTGRTEAMIELAELGRSTGAKVLGITKPKSPLAENCDLVLGVTSDEDTELYTPMTSRIAQLVMIDILVTCLALEKGQEFLDHQLRVKRNLASTRVSKTSRIGAAAKRDNSSKR
ncbi:MAG: RpiR family carbohydrate utilization transcriptional regulator [Halioglobus sp.]|jgi:RpiR family carbohydrate utilization transcriptional regulator